MQKRKMRRLSIVLTAIVVMSLVLMGACSKKSDDSGAVSGTSRGAAVNETKFLWYQAGAHPFFDEMWKGVEVFEREYGVDVEHGVGTNWSQTEEDQLIRAYAADAYNAMAIFPADPGGANGLYEELVGHGVSVVNFGATTSMPTPASFYCGTDIPPCAAQAATELCDVMEANGVRGGKVLLAIGALGDLNAQKCMEAAEQVFASRGVTVLQVVSDMSQPDVAQQKMGDAIAAHLSDLDGIVSTDTNPTDGTVPVLRELYERNPNQKHIYFIGRDTNEICLQAIRDGIFDGTSAQNAHHFGYAPMVLLDYLRKGWTPKENVYDQFGGHMIVNNKNIDTFQQEFINMTAAWKARLETDVFNPPK